MLALFEQNFADPHRGIFIIGRDFQRAAKAYYGRIGIAGRAAIAGRVVATVATVATVIIARVSSSGRARRRLPRNATREGRCASRARAKSARELFAHGGAFFSFRVYAQSRFSYRSRPDG